MMAIIYWVEDEIERLEGTKALLEGKGHEVRVINNASAALRSLGAMKDAPGPILFDLWIPPGDMPKALNFQQGPETGVAVLKEIRLQLGGNWPIWIVSGNLTRGLKERLMTELGISLDRIFSKPLNEKNASLVGGVLNDVKSLARGKSTGFGAPTAQETRAEIK
jgi:CheY-like chemotaxis protein